MARHDVVIKSAYLHGVEVVPVDVEVDLSGGIPGINVVGMPDVAVLEARSRVRCALRAAGFEIPRCQVTVNLAPGNIRKQGTGFDLPIAIGILVATGQIPADGLQKAMFVGELGLNGSVTNPRGLLAYLSFAKDMRCTFFGAVSAEDCSFIDAKAATITHLTDVAEGLDTCELTSLPRSTGDKMTPTKLDFNQVLDQEVPKRALTIAAAGGHGLLMIGPPGSGKTMLAKRIPTILPKLTYSELVETSLVHSVCGRDTSLVMQGVPPFSAPHHSSSAAGLLGGGNPIKPGEVSLAHNGILFLDELAEFSSSVLQVLRQPMEEGVIHLTRAGGQYVFPAHFQLIAASNPCPCGFLGDPEHTCVCSAAAIQKYQSKIGGPIMDRIDLVVDVMRPKVEKVIHGNKETSSRAMLEYVLQAKEFKAWRLKETNTPLEDSLVCRLGFSTSAAHELEKSGCGLKLGGRAVSRLANVARTIADINKHIQVEVEDVREATLFRSRETLGVAA